MMTIDIKRRAKSAVITVIAAIICLLCACGGPDATGGVLRTDDISAYDKAAVIEQFSGDLNSDLSVFPDEVRTNQAEYTVHLSTNLLDTDGRMILSCIYDDEQFESEISRLQSLSKTIRYGEQQHTNEVLCDEHAYAYPAYITIDGFGNTFEYALVDRDENRIVYIYLAYPGEKTLKQYSEYVKKDLSAYEEENTWDTFSMYNHSFDGGDSWIEFDDEIAGSGGE